MYYQIKWNQFCRIQIDRHCTKWAAPNQLKIPICSTAATSYRKCYNLWRSWRSQQPKGKSLTQLTKWIFFYPYFKHTINPNHVWATTTDRPRSSQCSHKAQSLSVFDFQANMTQISLVSPNTDKCSAASRTQEYDAISNSICSANDKCNLLQCMHRRL